MPQRHFGFWLFQAIGWLLLVYLIIAQGVPAFDYELGVAMGVQEPASRISEVGVAFFKGFAIGDVLVYIPLLGVGLAGQLLSKDWGRIALAGALGITVYWPIVSLATVAAARSAEGWNFSDERVYWIVLPLITLWGVWGLSRLIRESSPAAS